MRPIIGGIEPTGVDIFFSKGKEFVDYTTNIGYINWTKKENLTLDGGRLEQSSLAQDQYQEISHFIVTK